MDGFGYHLDCVLQGLLSDQMPRTDPRRESRRNISASEAKIEDPSGDAGANLVKEKKKVKKTFVDREMMLRIAEAVNENYESVKRRRMGITMDRMSRNTRAAETRQTKREAKSKRREDLRQRLMERKEAKGGSVKKERKVRFEDE